MSEEFSVQDKIVVVTGGGSGIGLAAAQLATSKGAKTIIADLKLTPGAESFVNRTETVIFQPCDVRNWADLEALIALSQDKWGDVPDVYIPAAGVFDPTWSNFWDDTEQNGYAALEINVNHPIKLTRIAIRELLRKNKKGVVCCVSSLAGIAAAPAAPLYTAAKHAIWGFVKAMAPYEAMEGVKVTAVCPGAVRTPLFTDRPATMEQYSLEGGELLSPEYVAECMFGLIEKGEYEGGAVLEVWKAGPQGQRVVPEWNISPSPYFDAHTPEVRQKIFAPVRETLARERNV
ncbi:NAD(P)-binding protein [Aspergillus homomorphus CBS 101889]|uniref:NAD(P)-binding protein n=1 Tax=Aspergillus homomorphus (strain CBS 101889) TaxID=1450537 RepID=A0A395I0I2_ASPHC|nr:NAD(P)-binding protein [Aspergillus homomorphus CBS 101889]RAL12648.1 NAD(P)-binding protein [Aspergillus homomorphus CBS 101889]